MSAWWPAAAAAGLTAWVLGWAWWSRRAFARSEGAFRCRVRVRSASLPGLSWRWSRLPGHGRWVHDVLVVRTGFLRPRLHHLPVHVAETELVELDRRRVRGLGPHPVSVSLLLDGQAAVEVATAGDRGSLLAGPFVVLAVSRLR